MSGSSDEMNCGRTKPSEDVKDLSLNSYTNTRERHLRNLVQPMPVYDENEGLTQGKMWWAKA